MCSLTFIPLPDGYVLGMNRDEQRTRPLALPPEIHPADSTKPLATLYPAEPSGGTWIGVNQSGVTLALLNWYSAPQPTGPVCSRGKLIPQLLQLTLDYGNAFLRRELTTAPTAPFRLFAIPPPSPHFPGRPVLLQWQWDGTLLNLLTHPWETQAWFSSGYDETAANYHRSEIFSTHLAQVSQPFSLDSALTFLRRVHSCHLPERGPNSICMHRADAQTVSYTEIVTNPIAASMRYTPGPPCETSNYVTTSIPIVSA